MRISILALLLCLSTVAVCQSSASVPMSSGVPSARPNTNLAWNWNKGQFDPKTNFNSAPPNVDWQSTISLLAQNRPAPSGLFKPWPKAKAEPIPTQWPKAKVEQIPTQWPNLKLQPAAPQSGTLAATQTPTK